MLTHFGADSPVHGFPGAIAVVEEILDLMMHPRYSSLQFSRHGKKPFRRSPQKHDKGQRRKKDPLV